MFKAPVPSPVDVRGSGPWQVHVVTDAGLTPLAVTDAQEIPEDYAVTGLVQLTLAAPLPSDYKRVEVRYTLGGAPLGVLIPAEAASSGIVPVDDPKKADVYLSGILLPSAGAKPVYTIDSRGNYPLWANSSGAKSLEVSGSAKADKRQNADLDSYVVGVNYRQVAQRGRRVNVHWFSGAEMNSKARVTNLIAAPRVVRPWSWPVYRKDSSGATTLAATMGMALDGAIETGWNLKNIYTDPDDTARPAQGSGGILRVVPGVTLYFVKPKAGRMNRIGLTARYLVRLLARDELFLETRTSKGAGKDPIPQMDNRARHFAQITSSFMLNEFAGLEFKYTYGSEPPAFKLADHNGAVGLVVKFRQTSRLP